MKKTVFSKKLFSFISSNLLQLKYLDISCSKCTDSDLEPIINLPNLKDLDISWNDNITGLVLFKFTRLKKLICRRCKNLENDALKSFLRRAVDLELLDIQYCPKLKTSVINIAIAITNGRTNNLTLEIILCPSQVDFKKIKDKSPFLYLILRY